MSGFGSPSKPVSLDPFQTIVNVHWGSTATQGTYVEIACTFREPPGGDIVVTPFNTSDTVVGQPKTEPFYVPDLLTSVRFIHQDDGVPGDPIWRVIATWDAGGNAGSSGDTALLTVTGFDPNQTIILTDAAFGSDGFGYVPGFTFASENAELIILPGNLGTLHFRSGDAIFGVATGRISGGIDYYNADYPNPHLLPLSAPATKIPPLDLNTDSFFTGTMNTRPASVIYNGTTYTILGHRTTQVFGYTARYICKKEG